MNGLRKLRRCLMVPLFRNALLRSRVAAATEHLQLLRSFRFATIIDIGANAGQFALVARWCFPDAKIVSFEPLRGPAERFRSIFANDDRVELHQTAISPLSGEATIHVSARDDSSSLLPISSRQIEVFPGTAETSTCTVRTDPLRKFVKPFQIISPALLKLDVQGFELDALKSCEDLLPLFDCVLAECSFVELYCGQPLADGVIAWLRERGFTIRGLFNAVYDKSGHAVQADCLFENVHRFSQQSRTRELPTRAVCAAARTGAN